MHKKILAGLAVGFIAAVGIAVPAQAAPFVSSSANADVSVIHGIPAPGLNVDVYVVAAGTLGPLGAPAIGPFAPNEVAENISLDASANYDLYIFASGTSTATLGNALASRTNVDLEANTSYTVIAHLNTSGAPVLTAFVNDVSNIPAGEGRLTVRHTANVGAVDILANGSPAFTNVTNPNEGKIQLPVGTIQAQVSLTGTTNPDIGPAAVNIKEGVNTIVYAVGGELAANPAVATPLGLLVQEITGLHSSPGGVNSGQAGLAADPNPALLGLGAAGVLALLSAAAFTVFRVRAVRTDR